MKIKAIGLSVFTGLTVSSPSSALSVNNSIFGQVNDRFHQYSQDSSGFGELTNSTSVRNAVASSTINVQPGLLVGHASAIGGPSFGRYTGTAWAVAFAGYSELITLDSPGLTGLSGQLSANFWLRRTLSGNGEKGGIGGTTLEVFTQLGEDEQRVEYSSPGHEPLEGYRYLSSNWPGTLVHLTTDFVFGEPLELELSLYSSNSGTDDFSIAAGEGSYDASSEFILAWAGVSDLAASNGSHISDYTIVSETGTDYSRSFAPPIPEPATYSTAGMLALVIVIFTRRKRNRKERLHERVNNQSTSSW